MAALDTSVSLERELVARTRRRGLGLVFWGAIAWIALILALAAFADFLPLADPTRQALLARRGLPSAVHPFGTDDVRRAIPAFPPLGLALAIVAYLGQSVANVIIVLAILTVPAITRIARAATLAVREREFVTAARALGASHARILLKEILPNILLPLGAFFLVLVAITIVAESILSFLGLGVPPPAPSWGGMIAEGRDSLGDWPHIAFIPAGVMFLTVLAFNLVGDTLRAITDPRRGA